MLLSICVSKKISQSKEKPSSQIIFYHPDISSHICTDQVAWGFFVESSRYIHHRPPTTKPKKNSNLRPHGRIPWLNLKVRFMPLEKFAWNPKIAGVGRWFWNSNWVMLRFQPFISRGVWKTDNETVQVEKIEKLARKLMIQRVPAYPTIQWTIWDDKRPRYTQYPFDDNDCVI